ncbi:MAG TPA: hypothetical protein VJ874_01145 [Candidatus Thermoplasmatota archaeon]|nr:hypothetical protein [Candidatus Thermoplasmatota archaeon]
MTFVTYVECLRCGRFVRAGTEGFCSTRHVNPTQLDPGARA